MDYQEHSQLTAFIGREKVEIGLLSAPSYDIGIFSMMPSIAESEDLAVVLIGSFNTKIFQPEWFLRHELLHKKEAEQAEIKFITSEFTDFIFDRIRVQVTPDRFVIDTADLSRAEKLYDVVLGTFKVLCHTPVTACGINHSAHFRVDNHDYWHKIGHTLAPKALVWDPLFSKPGMQDLTIKAPAADPPGGEINIKIQPSAKVLPGIFILANRSCDVPTSRHGDDSTVFAREFLRTEWKESLSQCGLVAQQIFTTIPQDATR